MPHHMDLRRIQLPEWLNNNFLETILKSDDENDISIISKDVFPATKVGDNYTSELYRMKVKMRRGTKEEKTTLIVKITRSGIPHTEDSLEGSLFERENFMYGSTLQHLYHILSKIAPNKSSGSPFFPKCIYTQIQPAPAIILEDLKEENFKMLDRGIPLDLNHCTLIMKKLAEFHAASVALKEKYPDSLNHYQKSVYCEEMRQNYEPFFVGTMRALVGEIHTWNGFDDEIIRRLSKLVDTAADSVIEILQPNNSDFTVLNHGDLWSNNIMFKYSEYSNELTDLRFMDYQQCHLGSPVLDILFFIYTNPNADLWKNYDMLLRTYHQELSNVLKKLRLQAPTFTELRRLFNEKALYGVVTACVVLPLVLADGQAMTEVQEVMEREEYGCEEYSVHLSYEYKAAMKMLLPMFTQNGWL